MAGLLYKDFAAVKGKVYAAGALAVLILFIILRFSMPDETGDLLLVSCLINIILLAFLIILYQLEIRLLETDEGKKQKNYFLSLPVTKKQYVASKYIFIILAFYSVLSFGMLTGFICDIHCQSEEVGNMLSTFMRLLPALSCTLLIIPAIEMPFFIIYGPKRGKQIKTGFVMVLFLAIVVFLLFGDITILDRISIADIMEYLEAHPDIFFIIQAATPYVSFLLYFLSYRISCAQFERREWNDD